MKKFFTHWTAFLLKIYPLVLLLVLGCAAASIPRMVHLLSHISTDPIDLLPREYPSVQTLLKVRQKANLKNEFYLILESNQPEQVRKIMEEIAKRFADHPLVGKVRTQKIGYAFFDQHKLLYMGLEDLKTVRDRIDRKIQQGKLGPLFVNLEEGEKNSQELDFKDLESKYKSQYGEGIENEYYTSPDGKLSALIFESKESDSSLSAISTFSSAITQQLEQFDFKAYDPAIQVYFFGGTKILEYRTLTKDLKWAGILAAVLIFLPLLIRFRKPHWVLLIFAPLALGIPIGFWIASIWIEKLNVTTSFLFAILGGLGVETGIHLFGRYYEKRKEGASLQESVLDLYLFYGPAILASVASLAATFFVMLFGDFRGFTEFGLIAGLGLLVLFVLYFTFFPALLLFAERIRLLRIIPSIVHAHSAGESRSSVLSARSIRVILLGFSLLTLFSVVATKYVQFEYDADKIRADHPELQKVKEKKQMAMGGRKNNPAIVLIHHRREAEAIEKEIERRKAQDPSSILEKTVSLYSLTPFDQDEKMRVIEEVKSLLADKTLKLVKEEKKKDLERFEKILHRTQPVRPEEIPAEVKEGFTGNPRIPGSFLFIYPIPTVELGNGRFALQFSREVENLKTSAGLFHPSSDAIVYGDVLRTIFQDARLILLVSVASLAGFVFLHFRSAKKTAIVLLSIFTGVFWVMGILWVSGMKLNLYNMVMIPSIMGMSIDNSIHMVHAYEELGMGSLGKVLKTAGVSCLLASLTNASGFISLLICHHGGLKSMGILASLGLGTCLLTTLIGLPLFLRFLELRAKKG